MYLSHHDFSIREGSEVGGSDGGRVQSHFAQVSRKMAPTETDPSFKKTKLMSTKCRPDNVP